VAGVREVIPRDDRAWPRGAAVISVVLVLAAAGTGVGLSVGAAGRSSSVMAGALAGFVVAFGFGLAVLAVGMRRWTRGHSFPHWLQLVQLAGLGVCIAVLYGVDGSVGGAMLAGLVGGMMFANVWAIRSARANRERVDDAEAAIEERGDRADDARDASAEHGHEAKQATSVGQALRDTLAVERRRFLAWLIAVVIAAAACGPRPRHCRLPRHQLDDRRTADGAGHLLGTSCGMPAMAKMPRSRRPARRRAPRVLPIPSAGPAGSLGRARRNALFCGT